MDALKITILPDGTIKMETGRVSAANHASAEAFEREVARLCGGGMTDEPKPVVGTLAHDHHVEIDQ